MKKILCIDDSVNLLQVLKKRFEYEFSDVSVITTMNGAEGINIAKAESPDLIILDIMMPDMDGEQVMAELKQSAKVADTESPISDIPVMILTAHGPELRNKYLVNGAVDYVSSPFDTQELVDKVRKILKL